MPTELTRIAIPQTLSGEAFLAFKIEHSPNGRLVLVIANANTEIAPSVARTPRTYNPEGDYRNPKKLAAMAKARAARWPQRAPEAAPADTPAPTDAKPNCRCVALNVPRVLGLMAKERLNQDKLAKLTLIDKSRISAMLHQDPAKRARALHRDVRTIATYFKVSAGKLAVPYMRPHARCRFE